MFVTISIIGLLAVALGVPLLCRVCGYRSGCSVHRSPRRLWLPVKALVLVLLASLVVLAVTGFYAALLTGGPLGGLGLMLHVSAGGAFIMALACLAVLLAESAKFSDAELLAPTSCPDCAAGAPAGLLSRQEKLLFWGLLALGMPAALTMLVSMLPIFGTTGLHWLYEAHRYLALGIVLLLLAVAMARVICCQGNGAVAKTESR